jgi:hypothetical protein
MQRALIASGVLGLGTALVFGAAAVTATLFPSGATVPANMNVMWARDDVMMAKPMPPGVAIPVPAGPAPLVITNEGGGWAVPDVGRGEKE